MRFLFAIFAAVFLTGCHESGTWNDDARNWQRIFRAPKPDNVTVVHSWFWRSPHFTYEYEYYIQIQTNADFQNRLLTMNATTEVTDKDELQKTNAWSEYKPAWFVPKPIVQYQIWVYSNAPDCRFRLLIDRQTGDLFLSDRQL